MNKLAFIALSVAVAAVSSSAFAQGKTRAEVYQELVEAQQNGLNYVTDTSYPDVNPIFAQQVQQHKQALAAQVMQDHMASGAASVGSAN